MMPSVKIENCWSAPPENMLNMPRNEPDPPRVTTWLISTRFTPGTVMNTPIRETARMNNVNKIRRRSSGTLPMFAIELATWTYLYRLALCGDLDRAARLLDLLLRGGRCAKRLDRELLGDLALAEDLDVLDELGDQALGAQRVEIDGRAGIEHALERRDVDRERLDAERVLEPTLGDPARHRHLTALEPQPRAVVARASLLALDALAGGLAGARAATAP